jgi:tripartite-type tricarboxylate transporter receptor subunit TctC
MKVRLSALALIATVAAAVPGPGSMAQTSNGSDKTYPWKVIQLIVPSPPGSPPDVRARELAEKVSAALGQPMIVLNKPGAGGGLGMQAAARSVPDGHTIVYCTDAPLTMNVSMYDQLAYDPVKDFTPVMIALQMTMVLVVNPTLPVNNVAELVRYAKSRPGELLYGSAGNGTPPHVLAGLFKYSTGLDLTHVAYKGGPAATTALLGGEVAFTIDAVSQVLPYIQSGKLKALAVTGAKRLAALPDVPTFSEAGIEGMDSSWSAIVAPAGTPRDVVLRLNREFARALSSPNLQAYYATIGVSAVASTPEELARRITEDTPKWRTVVKRAGITPG